MRNTALFILLRRMRAPLLVLIAVYAVTVLGLVLIPGVDASGRPYRMDFFHALYVISYTITTIGFGELPHTFTAGQRLWVMFSIYLGVIGWLYAVGTLIAMLQEPAIRQVIRRTSFAGSVGRIREPFYIVCGYGDTAALVVRSMTRQACSAVVLDREAERINELSLQSLDVYVPGLEADASQPGNLLVAGLKLANCAGVVALTGSDAVNLKIAITAKLLNPKLKVICRVQSNDTKANMESFGTDVVINHFDTFADRLAMALHSPDMYLLYEWTTEVPGEPLPRRISPPRGTWVLCGYGRFGKAVQRYLSYEGISTVIIEANPELTQAPKEAIIGRGTEAVTLREAHIEKAVGIVAGTDDDANNLSIIVTARDLNQNLFLVARQNDPGNEEIFNAAGLDLVMQRSRVISNRILSAIRTPLLSDFLRLARHKDNDWARRLIERMWPVIGSRSPELWSVPLTAEKSPAPVEAIERGEDLRLKQLLRDPRDRNQPLACLALLLKRGDKEMLLPDEDVVLKIDDEILICGRGEVIALMRWLLNDRARFAYIHTGKNVPAGFVFRRLFQHSQS